MKTAALVLVGVVALVSVFGAVDAKNLNGQEAEKMAKEGGFFDGEGHLKIEEFAEHLKNNGHDYGLDHIKGKGITVEKIKLLLDLNNDKKITATELKDAWFIIELVDTLLKHYPSLIIDEHTKITKAQFKVAFNDEIKKLFGLSTSADEAFAILDNGEEGGHGHGAHAKDGELTINEAKQHLKPLFEHAKH